MQLPDHWRTWCAAKNGVGHADAPRNLAISDATHELFPFESALATEASNSTSCPAEAVRLQWESGKFSCWSVGISYGSY